MRKQNAVQKFLVMLSFVVFLGAGYVAVNVATSPPAWAQGTCGTPCIVPGGSNVNFNFATIISAIIDQAISSTTAAITAFFTAAMAVFTATISDMILNTVLPNITGVIQTLWTDSLLPALQKMTRQLSTLNADQSRALASFTDAANLNRTRRELTRQEMDSHRAQRPGDNVCLAGTVAPGMTRAADFRDSYNAAASAEQAGRSGNAVGTPAATGGAADMNVRFQEYVDRYCNKDDNNGVAGCTSNGLFVGQDLDVTGVIFTKDTIDLKNAETRRIVDDLIRNLAEPFAKDPVPPGAVDSATGQAALLAGEAYRARRQVIEDSLYHVVSRRAPGSKMGDFVRPLRLAAGIDPALISPSPSHNEIMQAMMVERFRSGQYAQTLVDEPENNQREMVIQQAFQLMHLSDQLDLMDRYALMLAAQAGAEVRKAKHAGTASEGAPLR